MIQQQINLYQDRFREKRMWLSAVQVAAALAVMIVGAAIWSFVLHSQLKQANQQNLVIKANKEKMASELSAANVELANLLKDNRIERDIEGMARKISARKKVLNFVDANQFGSGEGFSAYLVALSSLHVDEIWLNQIKLAENFVQIKGSSLNAEQVPRYFDRFSDEEVFQGNRFEIFQLTRAEGSDWKVDFEIATNSDDPSGAVDE